MTLKLFILAVLFACHACQGPGKKLEMRPNCERCSKAVSPEDEVYICSYECTWCADCTKEMKFTCPNCGGDLGRRPTR